MARTSPVLVLKDARIAAYGFGQHHPFGPDRHDVFHAELAHRGLDARVELRGAEPAGRADLETFHAPGYLDFVTERCRSGLGFLDGGDTPAWSGLAEAGAAVVGATLAAVDSVMAGDARCAFVPIAGLHHAGRDHAAGFCVYNDCGVAIEHLRRRHGLRRIAYVDIDAHHGDGVYYAFEDDPDVCIADIHEDGRFLYPGTGRAEETGRGAAAGTKLNLPMPPGADDDEFLEAWERVEGFLAVARPEFVLLQAGADGLAGDPLTHLRYSERVHAHATTRLMSLAARCCGGRLVALGGGGYDRPNLARAWTAVVGAMLAAGGDQAGG